MGNSMRQADWLNWITWGLFLACIGLCFLLEGAYSQLEVKAAKLVKAEAATKSQIGIISDKQIEIDALKEGKGLNEDYPESESYGTKLSFVAGGEHSLTIVNKDEATIEAELIAEYGRIIAREVISETTPVVVLNLETGEAHIEIHNEPTIITIFEGKPR